MKKKSVIVALLLCCVLLAGCFQMTTYQTLDNNDLRVTMRTGYAAEGMDFTELLEQELTDAYAEFGEYISVKPAEWKEDNLSFRGYEISYSLASLMQLLTQDPAADAEELLESSGAFGWLFDQESRTLSWTMTVAADSVIDADIPIQNRITIDLPEQGVLSTTGEVTDDGVVFNYAVNENKAFNAVWFLTDAFIKDNFGILSVLTVLNLEEKSPPQIVDGTVEWLREQKMPEPLIEEFKSKFGYAPQPAEREPTPAPQDSLAGFGDVGRISSREHREALSKLVDMKVIFGDGKNILPRDNVTRAEAVTMIHRTMNALEVLQGQIRPTVILDVATDHWSYAAVAFARQHGIVSGTHVNRDGSIYFSPNDQLTFEQLGLMLENTAKALDLKTLPVPRQNLRGFSAWAVDGARWVPAWATPTATATREDFALMVVVLVEILN